MEAVNELLEVTALDTPTKRGAFAGMLVKWAQAWEAHIFDATTRWDRIDKMLANIPEQPKELPWDNAVYRNYPVLSPKARAWIDNVCNPPTQAKPYFLGTLFGKDSTRASELEDDFYMFMEMGRWTRYFRLVTTNAGTKSVGFWRVRVDTDDSGDPTYCYDSISPRAMVVYPNTYSGLKSALMVGHSYEETPREIINAMAGGDYFNDKTYYIPKGTEEKTDVSPVGIVDETKSIAVSDLDKPGKSYEVILKWNFDLYAPDDSASSLSSKAQKKKNKDKQGGEKLYRVRFNSDNVLLGIWNYPYSRSWYFQEWIREEEGKVIPESSKISDLQDLQLNMNNIANQMMWGVELNALGGTTYAVGWGLDRKYARNKPGAVIPIHVGGQIMNVQSTANPGVGLQMMQDIDHRASEVARIGTQQTAGIAQGADHTATAAQIRQQASNQAVDGDLENIDECMAEMGAFMQELYRHHYSQFLLAYKDTLSVQPDPERPNDKPDILHKKILWSLYGKTPDLTPQAQAQALTGLVQSLTQLANPQVIQALEQGGIDTGELMRSAVTHSVLVNKNQIVRKPGQPGNPPMAPPPPAPGIPGAPPVPPGAPPMDPTQVQAMNSNVPMAPQVQPPPVIGGAPPDMTQ